MKTREDLEKEYEEFQIKSDFVNSLDEFRVFLLVGIDDTFDIEKANKKEIMYNKLSSLKAQASNVINFLDEPIDVEFFALDNEILENVGDITVQFRNMYLRMVDIANGDNYLELLKLVDFCSTYYGKQIDYYEYLRDRLEMMYRGIDYSNRKYDDNKDAILEFIKMMMSKYDKDDPKTIKKV